MFNENEYQTIISNCQKDDNLANALSTLRSESLEELSVVSHEIKNYAAYLKTSYQFIARKTPDLKDNKFWNNMGVTIDELVEYMNRTSLYRYSFKDSEINEYKVSDILDIVNKYINKKYTDKVIISADTSGVVALSDTHFLISSHLLTSVSGRLLIMLMKLHLRLQVRIILLHTHLLNLYRLQRTGWPNSYVYIRSF